MNRLVNRWVAGGMRKAIQLGVGIAKKKVNRSQPTRGAKSGRRYGLKPSLPGTPPKVVTSELKRGIKGRVVVQPGLVRGFIGGKLVYMAPLELGSKKNHLAARPFLRPTILENKTLLFKVIVNG